MSDLTRNILKEFADIVIDDDKNADKETTAYGTTVESDGVAYVKLDGSNLLTPIVTTTDIKPGDRVLVMIKNHQAIIIGNSSNPSVGHGTIEGMEDAIIANEAKIKDLVADNVTINDTLTAHKAHIDELVATNVTIEGKLEADRAEITRLDTEKLNADEADIRYAKVTDLEATNADIVNLRADHAEFKDATIKRLDATDATIKNLDAKKLNADQANIKFAEIEELVANKISAGDFEAYKATIENLLALYATIEHLEAEYIKASKIDATYAKITELDVVKGNFETLRAGLAEVEILVANKADIKDLNAINAVIETLKADFIKVEQLVATKVDAEYVKAQIVEANKVITDDLEAIHAVVDVLETKYATIEALNAEIAKVNTLIANKADISELNAANANIGKLDALVANINTILSGSVGTGQLQAIHITGQNAVFDKAVIKSAYLDTIDTKVVNIATSDGGLKIIGNTQQWYDKYGHIRMQAGQDSNGNFTFAVYGKDGKTAVFNEAGITQYAVPDGLVTDKMVSDSAGIQAKKVQYVSSSGNKTLQTHLEVEQGRIDGLIKDTTIDGVKLKDKYTQLSATVDGVKGTIADVQTEVDTTTGKVTAMESRVTKVEATADGLKTEVSKASSDASSAKSTAEQAADKIGLVVKSGTSESNLVLTDGAINATANQINLKGLVKFEGLNKDTQNKINAGANAQSTIDQWNQDVIPDEEIKSTTINGEYIKTHSITTNQLNANEILAKDGTFLGIINAQEIDANRITTGYVRSNHIDVYGLTAKQKDTNIETFKIDNSGNVTIRGSIESFDYVSGKRGWSLNSNSDFEANNAILRGSVITNDGGIASSGGSGRNLLLNSSFESDFTNWYGSGHTITKLDGYRCVKFSGKLGKAKEIHQNILPRIKNNASTHYTVSAWVNMVNYNAGTTSPYVSLYFSGTYGSPNTWIGAITVAGNPFISARNNKGWTYMTWTVKFKQILTAMSFMVLCRDFTGDVYVRDLKIEEGDVATPWSLAPEDKIRQVRFWAGASYEERESAPFKVYNNGEVEAQDGTFSGIFTGEVKIGNISIVDPNKLAANDALLTIQSGDNGVKRVQLTDTLTSSFAQNIHIQDNFYNNKISLKQDGSGIFTNNIVHGNTTIGDGKIFLQDYQIYGGTTGIGMIAPIVVVGSTTTATNLMVYGNIVGESNISVKNEMLYGNIVKCTIVPNGLDWDFV